MSKWDKVIEQICEGVKPTMGSKKMSDYIKREDAIDSACANCIYDEFLSDRKKRIKEGITEIPPADVVEVVRCKDCKYADEYCHCSYMTWWNSPNDFCSRAERKDK